MMTLSNEKVNTLKEIFWAMNEVTFTKDVESHQETIIHLTWTEHKTVTHTKLHININHKTANEMVEQSRTEKSVSRISKRRICKYVFSFNLW